MQISKPAIRAIVASDWASLNATTPEQLSQILIQLNSSTPAEIEQHCALLKSYHDVYRLGLLKHRAKGYIGPCLAPTAIELQQIAQRLSGDNSPAQVLDALQKIAKLRQSYLG